MLKGFVAVLLVSLLSSGWLLCAQGASPEQTAQRLSQPEEQVRIVCFGDSITGRYYHSGGRRAWSDMLELALQRLYPKARLKVINAGISGNTSTQGLARMQKDVLDHHPHLVVIMFGMNDLAYGTVTPEQDVAKKTVFTTNLDKMIAKCRAVKAEVILCTQNPVYPEAVPARPPERVKEYASLIFEKGRELGVPVVDVYAEWEALRQRDLRAWRILMSETIHPSMDGHKRIAEQVAETVSGRRVSLADVLPEQPVCGTLISRLKAKQPVTIVVPLDLESPVRKMVMRRFPDADLKITTLPRKMTSLDAAVTEQKGVRACRPQLVFVTLPLKLLVVDTDDHYIRQASWLVNWSLPFGGSPWAVVGIDPALLGGKLTKPQQEGTQLLKAIVHAHDLDWIEGEGDIQDTLNKWFDRQLSE